MSAEAVAVALAAASAAMAPPDPVTVGVLLEETLELYGKPANWDRTVRFYFEAFEDVPEDLVALALRRLRGSPLPFFPKPGEIRRHIADELVERRRTLRRLEFAASVMRRLPPEGEYVPLPASQPAPKRLPPPEPGDLGEPAPDWSPRRGAAAAATFQLPDEGDPAVQAILAGMGVES